MRRAARKDLNQDAMVDCLERLGIRVYLWGDAGDLIAQYGSMTALCEVRQAGQPKKPREGRQAKFHEKFVVSWLQTSEDCVELAKTLRKWQQAVSERWAVQ